MGSPEIDIDFDEMFREVMQQPGVKGAVQGRAAKIAAVAPVSSRKRRSTRTCPSVRCISRLGVSVSTSQPMWRTMTG